MKKRVIYKGKDLNLSGMKCYVVKEEGDILTLTINEERLGKLEFKVHKSQTEIFE